MMSKNCPNAKNRMVVAGVAAVNDIVHTLMCRESNTQTTARKVDDATSLGTLRALSVTQL